jgi:hypothetical protein
MFPWKDFLMGQIRKIKKHKEERDRSGKLKKTRRKEWRKEKEENFYIHGGSHPYLCVLHGSGMSTGYNAHATLPQENPLEWEPPLQLDPLSPSLLPSLSNSTSHSY